MFGTQALITLGRSPMLHGGRFVLWWGQAPCVMLPCLGSSLASGKPSSSATDRCAAPMMDKRIA